ncbi:MAG: hypothetical protein ACRDXE_10735 [Acidimicrobiales bacterium]
MTITGPPGATYDVERVLLWQGSQIIVQMRHEGTGALADGQGSTYMLRMTADEAPAVIGALIETYAEMMATALMRVAAGGCRTCGDRRTVDGEPCPKCTPRAEKRVKDALYGLGEISRQHRSPYRGRATQGPFGES